MVDAWDRWVTRRLPEIYLAVALMVSSALCVLTPPFDTPDESAHARREIQLAQRRVIAEKTAQGVGGEIDANFGRVAGAMDGLRGGFLARYGSLRHLPDGRVTEAEIAPLEGIRWAGRGQFVRFPNTAVYPPGLYLPQALGWRIGEAAKLTILRSLLLARVCAMLCAIALGWLALRLCRSGRWLLAGYLLLPTVLNLGASCSQDALLLPMTALMMVLLLRAIEDRRGLRAGELVLLSVLLALCIGARVPYLPLALVLVLPVLEMEMQGWRKLRGPVVAIVGVVAVVGAWQLAVHSLGVYVGPGADPALQLEFLRQHPWRGGWILLGGMVREAPMDMVKGLFMLGSNDAGPAHAVYAVMVLGLAAISLGSPMAGLKSRAAKAVLVVALLLSVAGVSLAEYVVWTVPGAAVVEGLQARYFLVLIPFALLLGWEGVPRLAGRILKAWVRPLGFLVFLSVVLYIPFVAANVFYLSRPVAAMRFLLR